MWWHSVLVVAALAAALIPTSPEVVERWYSRGIYPLGQRVLTSISNVVPLAMFDILLLFGCGGLVYWIAVAVKQRRRHGRFWLPLRVGSVLITVSAALYLVFLGTWGLNYRRVPLREKLQFEPAAISPSAARDLGALAAANLNALYADAHQVVPADGRSTDDRLAASFRDVERALLVDRPAQTARPKHSLLDWYFRWTGVDGMTNPFFLETLVVSDLLPVERPFVVAHEWSHLAGFADESEANFVGWLTCVHGSPEAQYSGWLFLYTQLAGALGREDRVTVASLLAPGPRDDLRAIAERVRRNVKPALSAAGWRVYDRYLKANRIEAGVVSYSQVVQLVLGAKFDEGWRPIIRRREG